MENQITSSSMIKPEWGHCKVEPQIDYTFSDVQNEVEPKLIDLAFHFPYTISSNTLDREIDVTVKTEKCTSILEVENQSEIVLDEWKIKHEEVHLKEEELLQNEISTSSDGDNQEKRRDYPTKDGNNLVHGSVKEVQSFSCDKCDYKTRYIGPLTKHFLRHQQPIEDTIYKCNQCELKISGKRGFYLHLSQHSKALQHNKLKAELKCETCDFKTPHERALKVHILRHERPVEDAFFKCDRCEFKTSGKRVFYIHLSQHGKLKAELKCEKCDFKTMYRTHLRKHLLLHKDSAGEDLLKCCYCEYRTSQKNLLKIHLRRHKRLEDSTGQCSPSDHGTMGKSEELEGVNIFRCQDCDYISGNERLFKKHALRHNPQDVDLFECEKCDFKTIDKGSLRKHTQRHPHKRLEDSTGQYSPSDHGTMGKSEELEGVNIFRCQDCDYISGNERLLKKHALRHNPQDVDWFECEKCDFKTIDKWSLREHTQRHLGPKDPELFQCDHCDFNTRQQWSWKQHTLRHMDLDDVKVFQCDKCEFVSLDKSNIKRHALRHDRDPKKADIVRPL